MNTLSGEFMLTMDMNPSDLDLVYFRFAEAYQQNPEQAVDTLLALLLDPSVCRKRIDFLRGLMQAANKEQPGRFPSGKVDHFDREVKLIVEGGIFESLADFDVVRLDAFSRDPDALWRAHRLLLSEPPAQPPGMVIRATLMPE
jgi:hypothetical protein